MCITKESARFSLYGFNTIFVLTGAALITIGAIYTLTFNDLAKAIPSSYISIQLIPILTIFVGALTFLVAFFSFWCVFIDKTNVIFVYAGVLLGIFFLQVAVGVFTFVEIQDQDDLSDSVNRTLDDIFVNLDNANFTALIQSQLRCCGTYGATFWSKTMNKTLPMSCCENYACDPYEDGCQNALYTLFVEAAQVTGISLLAFSVTEVSAAIFAIWYANEKRKINKGYRRTLLEE